MTTPYLHGNHDPCPACNGSGESSIELTLGRSFDPATGHPRAAYAPCKPCKGSGRKTRRARQIANEAAAQARRLYWPQFEERTARHG